ncbi:MAG: hypothetical protein A3J59_04860 [Candidatus Buchananbacteria bacterium RIFCSPHIGHO2_02_FULL_56_16]|uniref:DUF4190 domain-containing protein n=1 Tax=Candidatus Buchananbacteria bacterium RIFCSPHIGHO2_02_FULL_56_16 TaxID=1797542 RepID=A0A1G1YHM0_9BACT|nr:MAG: hypothetical protein A3J59_04860 [Candidatus Buchananbacteria bacterium RIFCSPHIGHO2_02_FULL_56_16]
MRFVSPAALLISILLFTGSVTVANAQVSQELLSGEAGAEMVDQSEAFLETSGLQPVQLSIVVAQIIQVVLGLLGVIFIVLIIYAGFNWMTSAGNEDRIGKSKKTIAAAVIGLVIVLAAYLITAFVLSQLFEATQTY